MRDETRIRISLTSTKDGESAIDVIEVKGAWGVQEHRQVWFGTYKELAAILDGQKSLQAEGQQV